MKVDLVSSPPALHSGPHVFPLSTEVTRLFILPLMLETQEGRACYTSVASADLWHRRLGHCNSRALLQLAKNESTGVQFSENIKPGDCHICSVGKSKKRPHPPLVRPRAETRLAVAHADLWGKHSVPSYGGCQYVTMFTDDMTQMRWAIPIKTKDEAVDALRLLVREVADPEGISIGTIRCDGGGEFHTLDNEMYSENLYCVQYGIYCSLQ